MAKITSEAKTKLTDEQRTKDLAKEQEIIAKLQKLGVANP
jgi:hypothetical protein